MELLLSLVRIPCVGSVRIGLPSDRDSNSGREKFLMSRERAGACYPSWQPPPSGCRWARPIPCLETDAVGASETCCYPVLCNVQRVHPVRLSPHRVMGFAWTLLLYGSVVVKNRKIRNKIRNNRC